MQLQVWEAGGGGLFPGFRAVQVLAGRQFLVLLEMLRAQRFRDGVLLAEPFAQVHKFASLRAKRPVSSLEPFARLSAGGAFHARRHFHSDSLIWRPSRREYFLSQEGTIRDTRSFQPPASRRGQGAWPHAPTGSPSASSWPSETRVIKRSSTRLLIRNAPVTRILEFVISSCYFTLTCAGDRRNIRPARAGQSPAWLMPE